MLGWLSLLLKYFLREKQGAMNQSHQLHTSIVLLSIVLHAELLNLVYLYIISCIFYFPNDSALLGNIEILHQACTTCTTGNHCLLTVPFIIVPKLTPLFCVLAFFLTKRVICWNVHKLRKLLLIVITRKVQLWNSIVLWFTSPKAKVHMAICAINKLWILWVKVASQRKQ